MSGRRLVPLAFGLIVLLTAAASIPSASAHSTIHAREVEILVRLDEADDSFYYTGGYDLCEGAVSRRFTFCGR